MLIIIFILNFASRNADKILSNYNYEIIKKWSDDNVTAGISGRILTQENVKGATSLDHAVEIYYIGFKKSNVCTSYYIEKAINIDILNLNPDK